MDAKDLRDPARERRRNRLRLAAVVAVAALALSAAALAAVANRPLDHHYVFTASYTSDNGVPYTLRLPLPGDGELRGNWALLGNATAVEEASPYGTVLKISAWSNISVTARLNTWRDLPLTFTTEGLDDSGQLGVRARLDSSPPANRPVLKISFAESDPAWNTTRVAEGDLLQGWNTFRIRASQTANPYH